MRKQLDTIGTAALAILAAGSVWWLVPANGFLPWFGFAVIALAVSIFILPVVLWRFKKVKLAIYGAFVLSLVALALVQCLAYGAPRNQRIDSLLVERKVRVGMRPEEVESVLHLPAGTMSSCSRHSRRGGTEAEIVGSSPPWRFLRPGYHTVVLWLDRDRRVTGGYGIWWSNECSDMDSLQLERMPDSR